MIVGGTISATDPSGSEWDGGLFDRRPDPQFCLILPAGTICTDEIEDTLQPDWNAQFPSFDAAQLNIGLQFELLDIDDPLLGGNDDVICEGVLSFSPSELSSGSAMLTCDFATLTFTLMPE